MVSFTPGAITHHLSRSFVHYSTGDAADAAIKAVNGMLLNDKKVFVGHHVGKKERQSKVEEQRAQFTNIFVKNIDPEATDNEFEELFTPFGDIVSAALGRNDDGTSKGYVACWYLRYYADNWQLRLRQLC